MSDTDSNSSKSRPESPEESKIPDVTKINEIDVMSDTDSNSSKSRPHSSDDDVASMKRYNCLDQDCPERHSFIELRDIVKALPNNFLNQIHLKQKNR